MVSQCCVEGFKLSGTAVGTLSKIADVDVYITGEKTSKNVLLFLPDFLGVPYKNNQLIADNFAKEGYLSIVVDTFKGDPANPEAPGFDLYKWFGNHAPDEATTITEKVLAAIKEEYKPSFVAGVGYCYGAHIVGQLLAKELIDVGGWAHPSIITPELVKAVKKPLIIAAAEEDNAFSPELRSKTLEILAEQKATYSLTVFSGTHHGFACRGDESDPVTYRAMKKAFCDQIWWFDQFKN